MIGQQDDDTTTMTIKGIPTEVKQRLRVQAAKSGRSMAEEARHLLDTGTKTDDNAFLELRETLQKIGRMIEEQAEKRNI